MPEHTELSTRNGVIAFLEREDVLGPCGESENFTDVADAYGEPGYELDGQTPLIVLGYFWCQCADAPNGETYADGQPPLHDKLATHFPDELQTMEANGVEFVWYDEWTVIHEYVQGMLVANAYRTVYDSYHWQPSITMNDNTDEYLTPNSPDEEWMDWAMNDASRCIPEDVLTTDPDARDADENGEWKLHAAWDGTSTYRNGWHDHMNDTPEDVANSILRDYGHDTDYVFVLTGTSQFYIEFEAYYRTPVTEDDED